MSTEIIYVNKKKSHLRHKRQLFQLQIIPLTASCSGIVGYFSNYNSTALEFVRQEFELQLKLKLKRAHFAEYHKYCTKIE